MPDSTVTVSRSEADAAAAVERLLDAVIDRVVEPADAEGQQPVSITRHAAQGHPAKVLLDAAGDADLLVVGSRGHGGFVGALLGSVSHHVVSHAGCPVVVVPDST